MPSPLGHMIGGVTAGWLVSGVPVRGAEKASEERARSALTYACLGALPDLDLLIGMHRGPTHSIGAALFVGIAAAALLYLTGHARSPLRTATLAAACAGAFGSHVLLDWLSSDSTAPIGIMALWPLDNTFYASDLHVFMAISRRYYHGWPFVWQNLLAVTREVAILLPLVSLVMMWRQRPELR